MSNKYPKFSVWLFQSSLILATLTLLAPIAASPASSKILLAQSQSQVQELPSDKQIASLVELYLSLT
jgi:hypothetical protein